MCIKQDTHRHNGIQFLVSMVSHSMKPLVSIKLTHIVPSDRRAIFEVEICFGVQSCGALIINLNRRYALMALCPAISPPHNNHISIFGGLWISKCGQILSFLTDISCL